MVRKAYAVGALLRSCLASLTALSVVHLSTGFSLELSRYDLESSQLQRHTARWDPAHDSVQVANSSEASRCPAVDAQTIAAANLTAQELASVSDICWRPHLLAALNRTNAPDRRGIPQGVTCTSAQWCDKSGQCSEVCQRGSVVVDPWIKFVVNTQNELAYRVPFCLATLLGTHNSGITLADGYGNLDPAFQEYFKWIKWLTWDEHELLLTNNQWLSLTDQLSVGARHLELDTHWVAGELRIAHCGGVHSLFDKLIRAVNVVAKLLHHDIRWDTETIGCDPSLSSIPAAEQRTLASALQEVAAWQAKPENKDEFLILYFDDELDLGWWTLVQRLVDQVLASFPPEKIFTPLDYAKAGRLPSIAEMMTAGKRVVFVSRIDYGDLMAPWIFSREDGLCDWLEPDLFMFEEAPMCSVGVEDGRHEPTLHGGRTLEGQLYRESTCELEYGPMNCNFNWKTPNGPLLNEETLPGVVKCGMNLPCPDLLTPQRVASAVWTWAPGHPFRPVAESTAAAKSVQRSPWVQCTVCEAVRTMALNWWRRVTGRPLDVEDSALKCTSFSATDGFWRAALCDGKLATPCRKAGLPAGALEDLWQLTTGPRGECPAGTSFEVPHHAKESLELQAVLRQAGAASCWLPVYGPSWRIVWPNTSNMTDLEA